MLDEATTIGLAGELDEAARSGGVIESITKRFPDSVIADAYAIQREWLRLDLARGRRIVGRKIGLTSRAMQMVSGIDEPDYGFMLDGTVFESGVVIPAADYANVGVEVELAFVLKDSLSGPDVSVFDVLRATEFVTPALEILSRHYEGGATSLVDTIADNAAYGAIVLGGRPIAPDATDLRWAGALLHRNEAIEETGVAAGVLGHPALGVAWLARRLAQHGERLEAGEIILAGSFTRPVWVSAGDVIFADYNELGTITCRFS